MAEREDERMNRVRTERLQRPLPKRFYQSVSIGPDNSILLDGRSVKTPMRSPLVLPNRELACAVAKEWNAQIKFVNPDLMPLTKLANTAIDRATSERSGVINEFVDYVGSDLVCYLADRPPQLVAQQTHHWQPIRNWARQEFGHEFKTSVGVLHVAQEIAALEAVRARAENWHAWHLTGCYLLTTLTGSALISMMLNAKAITADAAWAAAQLDEDYQISQWGQDWEAEQRRTSRKREFDGVVRFLELLE